MRHCGVLLPSLPGTKLADLRPNCTCPAVKRVRREGNEQLRRTRVQASVARSGFEEYEGQLEQKKEESMKEYAELKSLLLQRLRTAGGLFGLYFTFAVSPQAGLLSFAGSCGSYVYFLLLMQKVDSVSPNDDVPMRAAEQQPEGLVRNVAKLVASYRHALTPRLLVLVGLAAAVRAYNSFSAEPLSTLEEACLLAGFLAYKVPLFQGLYDDLKPKFDPDKARGGKQPTLADAGDLGADVDIYGRKKESTESKIQTVTEDDE